DGFTDDSSGPAVQDEVGQSAERLRRRPEGRERPVRLSRERGGAHLGRGETVDPRISDLLLPLVLAGRLPERLQRALDVEDVVDDLEGEADAVSVRAERRQLRLGGAGQERARAQGSSDERRGLAGVDVV